MKLLHTADWHLGQTLAGHERTHEHRLFLQWLLRTLQERQLDALLIAGDVFDQASPPAQAQALYYDFLAQARRAMPKLAICIIAGNHDSPGRNHCPSPSPPRRPVTRTRNSTASRPAVSTGVRSSP